MSKITIEALAATNMRRIREGKGWLQETLAQHACADLGVAWTRESVLRIEAGRRKLTLGELVGLCFTLQVGLDELLRAPEAERDVWVVPDGLRVPLKDLSELLTSGIRGGAERPIDRRAAPTLSDYKPGPPDLAEQRAAKAIGTDVVLVRLVAHRIWGRSLSEERDRRAGANANRTDKAHVMRTLYGELQAALAQLRG